MTEKSRFETGDLDVHEEIFDIRELERRFHTDPKFHELVAVMASAVEAGRSTLQDIQDAVTLLRHAGRFDQPRAIWTPPRF